MTSTKLVVVLLMKLANIKNYHKHKTMTAGTSALCAKRFVKITPGVNFTNILLMPFLHESVLLSFSLITIWLWDFRHKEIGKKSCS
jgi:hypothetical protein